MSVTPGAQMVGRVAEILRCLSSMRRGLRLSEVVSGTGLQQPTVHRILQALINEGMVRHDADSRRYRLGSVMYEFGLAAEPVIDLVKVAAPSIDRLAGLTGDTAFLTSRSGYHSICLDRREGSYPVRLLTVEINGRRPLGTTAGGLALLCDLPLDAIEDVVTFNSPSYLRYGKLDADRVRELAARGRELGYGLNEDDITDGVTGIGVSVPATPLTPHLALSVVALSSRLKEHRREKAVAILRAEAVAFTARLDAEIARSMKR